MKFIKKYSYVLCVIVLIVSCIFAVVGIGTAMLKDNAKKNVITAEITETREVAESTTTSTVSETTTTTVTTNESTSTLASTSTSCTETTVAETIPTVETTVEMPITIAETVVDTTYTETVEVSTEAEPAEIYYVYKPSTRYVHVNTCKWVTSDCRRVEDESDIGESARLCDECNPDFTITDVYSPSSTSSVDSVGTFVRTFSRGTYYPGTAYNWNNPYNVYGGSGRSLIGYGNHDSGVKGSIASKYLYNLYGYYVDGRTKFYIEVPNYPNMNGYYYLDDCSGADCVDFFVYYESDCPFYSDGVVTVNVYTAW